MGVLKTHSKVFQASLNKGVDQKRIDEIRKKAKSDYRIQVSNA